MTKEQQEERKQDVEHGHIKELKEGGYLCKDTSEPFVFISYKSDDWKEVLYDIVYKLCKKYGMRVYFDTRFDVGSDLWIDQFYENMCAVNCKAMLAFVSDKYYRSYATLMELMASQTWKANKARKMVVLPVQLGKITEPSQENNTGLGTSRYSDGTVNQHWQKELKQFNKFFELLIRKGKILEGKDEVYDRYCEGESELEAYQEAIEDEEMASKFLSPGKNGKIYLDEMACYELTYTIIANLGKNDIYINAENEENDHSVKVIYDKLQNKGLDDVFDKTKAEDTKVSEVPSPPATDGNEKIWVYKTKKGAFAQLLWNGESKCCTVLKNSKVAPEAAGFAALQTEKKLKDSLIAQGVLVNDCFVKDYDCDKIATMIKVLNGGSVSMPAEIRKKRLVPAGEALEQSPAEKTQNLPPQPTSGMLQETPLVIPSSPNGTQTTAMTSEAERQASCTMSLEEFVRKYNNSRFTKKSFDQVRLRKTDGSYVGEFWNGMRELVWQFMMKLITDNGEAVMQRINEAYAGNNPIFIPADQISEFKMAYRKVDGMTEWAMCTNYSQPAWLANFEKWMKAVGIDSRDLQLEFKGFCA